MAAAQSELHALSADVAQNYFAGLSLSKLAYEETELKQSFFWTMALERAELATFSTKGFNLFLSSVPGRKHRFLYVKASEIYPGPLG